MPVWDRQRDNDDNLEPILWFNRFDLYYRPRGPERNLLAAVNMWREREGNKGRTNSIPHAWFNAHRDWKWKERAEAWDAEQRRIRLIDEQRAISEMNKRHVELSKVLQYAGGQRLQQIANKVKKILKDDPTADIDEITITEARHLLRDGMAAERKALGLPDHLLKVAEMSNDELLREYLATLAEIGGTPSGDDQSWDFTTDPETD